MVVHAFRQAVGLIGALTPIGPVPNTVAPRLAPCFPASMGAWTLASSPIEFQTETVPDADISAAHRQSVATMSAYVSFGAMKQRTSPPTMHATASPSGFSPRRMVSAAPARPGAT